MSYTSKHRLSTKYVAEIPYKAEPPIIQHIKQPQAPNSPEALLEKIRNKSSIKEYDIASMAKWLKDNNHPPVPEHTSHPGMEKVSDIALVSVCHGTDELRIAACNKALPRLLKADPQPAAVIVVEALEEGQKSNLDYLKSYPQVTHIEVRIKEKNKYLFQKEALWTIGTRKAFEIEGVTKVVAVDADCAFDDNSWPYVISKELDTNGFVQPFIGMHYSNQRDVGYGPSCVSISEAYSLTNKCEGDQFAPGGSFACTKKLFEEVFDNRWPYRPVGSGDVATWAFLRGTTTESAKKPSNVEDSKIIDDGQCPYIPIHYAKLILNHYYHGPMSNRMYGTRNYLAKKYNNPETVVIDEQGLLAWSDTTDGKIFKECFTTLKKKTNAYVAVHRQYTLKDTKSMVKSIESKYYGSINTASPLIITSVYRNGYDKSKEVIMDLYKKLVKHCQNPFEFILFTDTKFDASFEQVPLNLNYLEAPSIWRRMSIFQKKYNSTDNVLFVDPKTEIVNDFYMVACPSKHLYLARHDSGHWDSSLMYFKNLPKIFEEYKQIAQNKTIIKPEYTYLEPALYLLTNWHDKNITFKNIIIHADYHFKGERAASPISDFILK